MAAIQGHGAAKLNTATGSLLEAIAKEDEAKAQRVKAQKEAKPADLDVPPEGSLRRGQFYYRKWGPELCSELMYFSEPLLRDIPRVSPGVRTRTSEYVEYAWDVKIVGPTGDMIFTDQKGDQFQRMKTIYIENGSRLAPLIEFIRRHEINWQIHGVYLVSVDGEEDNARVKVHNKLLNVHSHLDPCKVGEDAQHIKCAQIIWIFSMSDAHIVTAADNYRLSDCFVAHRRRLKRNSSGPNAICAAAAYGKKAKVATLSPSPSASPRASPPPKGACGGGNSPAGGGNSLAPKGAGKVGKAAGSAAGSADVFPRRQLAFPGDEGEAEAGAEAANDGEEGAGANAGE